MTGNEVDGGGISAGTNVKLDQSGNTSGCFVPDLGGGGESCAARYGVAASQVCQETATSCAFVAVKNEQLSCNDVCAAKGGKCLGAKDNSTGCTEGSSTATCETTTHNDDICICSR